MTRWQFQMDKHAPSSTPKDTFQSIRRHCVLCPQNSSLPLIQFYVGYSVILNFTRPLPPPENMQVLYQKVTFCCNNNALYPTCLQYSDPTD